MVAGLFTASVANQAQAANPEEVATLKTKVSSNPLKDAPITLVINGVEQTATLTITDFYARNGQIYAVSSIAGPINAVVDIPVEVRSPYNGRPGNINGEGTSLEGGVEAQAPVQCDIINLVLGPLDLNILGLEVHLNQVVLDVVGATGSGNLLGNLLCAITGLLDLPGAIVAIANLLDRVLDVLNGL